MKAALGNFGGVQEFLEKHADKYEGAIEVADGFTPEPTLVLTRGHGDAGSQAEFKVGTWKTEHIQEFLNAFVSAA